MERIGPYEVLDELGQGGMARVVRARHLETGAVHALKLLDGATGPEEVARFRREAEMLSTLAGQDVVPVHAVGVERGRAWLALELMPGGSLRDRLRRGPLPLDQALEIVRRLAASLARAHARGLVHRDVKPENVLFDEQGSPRLADFGLARDLAAPSSLTASGALLGTPGYLSPEAMSGARAGPAADAFALGVLLHELLAGRRPFVGATPIAQLEATVSGRREPPPEAPPGVLALLDRLLEPDPARRLGVDELARALEGGPPAPSARSWRAAGIATAALVLVLAALAAAWRAGSPTAERPAPTVSPPPSSPPAAVESAPADPVRAGCENGPPIAASGGASPDLDALHRAAQVAVGDLAELPPPKGLGLQVQQVLEGAGATRELLLALRTHGLFFEATDWIPRASREWRATFARVQLAAPWREAFGAEVVRRLRLEMLPRRSSVHRWSTNEIRPALQLPVEASGPEGRLLPALRELAEVRDKNLRASHDLAQLALAAQAIQLEDPVLAATARLLLAERLAAPRSELEAVLAQVLALEGQRAWPPAEEEALVYLRRTCHRRLLELRGPGRWSHYREALGGGLEGDERDLGRFQLALELVAHLSGEPEAASEVLGWSEPEDAVLLRCQAAAEALSGRVGGVREKLDRARQLERSAKMPFDADKDLVEGRAALEAAVEALLVRGGRQRSD